MKKPTGKNRPERLKYVQLVESIARLHTHAQAGAAAAVSQFLILRNWLIGARIVEFEQQGAERAAYGKRLLARLSTDLVAKGVRGCSADMLERMRQLYQEYPQLGSCFSAPAVRNFLRPIDATQAEISVPVVRKSRKTPSRLPAAAVLRYSWTQLIEFLRISDPWKRAFYENECLKGNWSKRQLQRQIGSLLYERTGLSKDKAEVIRRAQRQESPGDVAHLLRDPYVLEFTGLGERPEYTESDLEKALLDHLQQFLLELGTGFCFEARQKRITVGNEHDYIDLVFYHRRLRCHVLLDLKTRPFTHGDAGQMNFYLNWWKAHGMDKGDQLPVGILLCSDRDRTKVEFATVGMNNKVFVSRYLVALPSPKQLQEFVERDRARIEAQMPKGRTE